MPDVPTSGAIAGPPVGQGLSGDVRSPTSHAAAARPFVRRTLSVLALAAIDLTSLVFAIMATLALKLVLLGAPIDLGVIWTLERNLLPLAGLTTVLVFARFGLYAHREYRPGAAAVLSATTVTTLILLGFAVLTGRRFTTYYIFYTSWFTMNVLVLVLRGSYNSLTAAALDRARYHRRALLVGEPELTAPVAASLTADPHPRRGVAYTVVGTHAPVGDLMYREPSPDGRRLHDAIAGGQVDEVIVTGGLAAAESLSDLLLLCRRHGVQVRLAPTTNELLSYTLRPSVTPGLPLLELRPPSFGWIQFRVKRAFDMVAGGALIILTAPIVAVATLAVRLESGGPVLFRSSRIGLNQLPFSCLKIRTMQVDAHGAQDALEGANEASGPLFKIKDDPRVTRVGRVLRRFSIDELPQLWNVVRGDMSLVGPRPLPERDFALMDEEHKRRYVVMPGLTGLWQVSGRADFTADELIRLDIEYIETWSIWLDIVIIARTIPVVLAGRGSY